MPIWRNIAHGVAEAVEKATRRPDAAPPPPRNIGIMQGQLDLPDAPRSAFLDSLNNTGLAGEWREHPLLAANSSFARLRAAVVAMPILGVILKTRADQLAQFAHPAETRYDMGFQILPRDKGVAANDKTEAETAAIAKFVFNCGVDTVGSAVRDDFPTYMRKVSMDSLLYAQDATEIVLDRTGRPAQWYAVDAATMRFAAKTSPVYSDDLDEEIRYCQVMHGVVVTAYRYRDMIFGIRNPSTDVKMAGYGTSEIETVMRAISALIFAFDYNMKYFLQGTSAKGIINMKGEGVSKSMIDDFRYMWKTMVSGTANAHTIPVVSADNFEYTDLAKSNKDIEYQQYVDFLIKVITSAYSMSPDEINFQYGNVGQSTALSSQDNRGKIVESRVRGLRPHLQLREHLINTRIIWERWPQYKLAFTGLDAMTRQEAIDFNTKLVSNTHTVDEVRAMDGLAPLADGLGENLLNPTYAQLKQAQQMSMMQPDLGGVPQAYGVDASDPATDADVDNEDDNNDVDGEVVNKSKQWEI